MANYTERELLIAWVLWLVGHSESAVGQVIGRRKKQVAGLVNRSPYPNRSAMSIEERRVAIAELMLTRYGDDGKPIDGGLLDRVSLTPLQLRSRQVKRRGT